MLRDSDWHAIMRSCTSRPCRTATRRLPFCCGSPIARREGLEADALQPDQLAVSPHRRSACASEGRQRAAAGLGGADDPPVAAARPRRRGARHSAYDRPRSAARAEGNRCRDLVLAMVVARLPAPASKLATARALIRRRRRTVSASCWAWARSTRMSCTLRSTGSPKAQPAIAGGAGEAASRGRHAGALRRLVELSARDGAVPARRRSAHNRDGKKGASCRSSPAACCAPPTAARLPSRCSMVPPPT